MSLPVIVIFKVSFSILYPVKLKQMSVSSTNVYLNGFSFNNLIHVTIKIWWQMGSSSKRGARISIKRVQMIFFFLKNMLFFFFLSINWECGDAFDVIMVIVKWWFDCILCVVIFYQHLSENASLRLSINIPTFTFTVIGRAKERGKTLKKPQSVPFVLYTC